jgi:hypothetical protein
MLTKVRYIYVPLGGSPNYETREEHDREADHQSFAGLMAAVSRPGKKVIAIEQRGVAAVCTDADS